MGKYFWAKSDQEAWQIWKNIVKNNDAWLAKMAGTTKFSGTADENIKIANRLRANDVKPFYDYKTNAAKIDNFDEMQKINASKNLLDQQTMQYYIANLDDDQIAALNNLSPTQRLLFIAEESAKIENIQWSIQTKIALGGQIENKNLAVMKELDGVIERTNEFLKKIWANDLIMNATTWVFESADMEKEYLEYKKKQQAIDSYQKLIKEGKSEETIDKVLRNWFRTKKFTESEAYASLKEEQKSEFDGLVVDYYTVTQKLNVDLESFDLGILNVKARETLAMKYGDYEKEPAHTLMNTVNADKEMISFFAEDKNKITRLAPETSWSDKLEDKSYYAKIFALYPDAKAMMWGTKPVNEYLEYFNDDMTIKDGLSATEKEEAAKALEYLKEDKTLVEKTNEIVQDHAMSQCVESLQQYMDIDINEKEKFLEEFNIMKGTDVVSPKEGELVLNINGERDGKKITLSYDMISGNVYACPFLYKNSVDETGTLVMGNQQKHDDVPLTTLASISTILSWAQEANYQKMFLASDDAAAYEDAIGENMDRQMIFWKSLSYDMSQDMLKKQIIQGDIVQNIISCTWKDWGSDAEISNEWASKNVYGFYQYIYRSLEYCSMKSVDQLVLFNKNIMKLLDYRTQNSTKSIPDVLAYKDKNQEMFVIQSLMNQSIIPTTASKLTEQWPEENLMSFFKCFEKEIWGIDIIDTEIMDDYFTAAMGTNKEENKVGKRERNQDFTALVNDLETRVTWNQATVDLQQQLKDQNIS